MAVDVDGLPDSTAEIVRVLVQYIHIAPISGVASTFGARGQQTSRGPRPSLLFSLSSFSPFFSLSLEAPFSSGPLDIAHPCHPLATPLAPINAVLGLFGMLSHRGCGVARSFMLPYPGSESALRFTNIDRRTFLAVELVNNTRFVHSFDFILIICFITCTKIHILKQI